MTLEPEDYAPAFASHLVDLGLEVALVGALAARRYRARARLTTDVDFLARDLHGVADQLRLEGYEVRTMAEPGGRPYLVFVRGRGRKVDLIAAETPFQHNALDRAVDGVITAEDVIVFKLLAWRPRDRDDIASILEAGQQLDEAYIERWAGEWEVTDRWEEAKRSFGL